jgi:hypothetical protein
MSAHSREWYQQVYGKKTYNTTIVAGDSTTLSDVIAARNANWTVYIQSIQFACTTGAAQSLTFQDDNGTPKVIAKTIATGVTGEPYLFDFGPEGIPLTQGKNLDVTFSGAGLAGSLHIEGYQKLTGAPAATSA